jgi:hypothetical protein
MLELIATLPPYARHLPAIVGHPAVGALRFNTIMPVAESKRDVLANLRHACGRKPLWLDLKGRQLRITRFAYLPHAFVDVSRKLSVDLPARVVFKDGEAELVRIVDGDRLILTGRPPRVVGAGEPIGILDPSLQVEGYLTQDDREWVEAARALGLHDYLLSFVERASDLDEVRALDPDARVVAKIESRRGLDFVRDVRPGLAGPGAVRLMAARDDLFVQLEHDVAVLDALEQLNAADPTAIVASRLLCSLEAQERPSLGDLTDLALMVRLGYRSFMLSDEVCFREATFTRALDAWERFAAWVGARA